MGNQRKKTLFKNPFDTFEYITESWLFNFVTQKVFSVEPTGRHGNRNFFVLWSKSTVNIVPIVPIIERFLSIMQFLTNQIISQHVQSLSRQTGCIL